MLGPKISPLMSVIPEGVSRIKSVLDTGTSPAFLSDSLQPCVTIPTWRINFPSAGVRFKATFHGSVKQRIATQKPLCSAA